MSRPLPISSTFLPPTHGVLKSLLENPMKLPFHHDEGKGGWMSLWTGLNGLLHQLLDVRRGARFAFIIIRASSHGVFQYLLMHACCHVESIWILMWFELMFVVVFSDAYCYFNCIALQCIHFTRKHKVITHWMQPVCRMHDVTWLKYAYFALYQSICESRGRINIAYSADTDFIWIDEVRTQCLHLYS